MPPSSRTQILLREYDTLEKGEGNRGGHAVPEADFDDIRDFVADNGKDSESLLEIVDSSTLRARNHVGILQTRRGITVEILPKIDIGGGFAADGRDREREKTIFLRMLRAWRGEEFRSMDHAEVRALRNFPLLETFIAMFLNDLLELTRRGIARSYVPVERNQLFLKGKLLPARQLRRNLVHRERFFVRYQEFSADRPANRLLKSTLMRLQSLSRKEANRTRIRQALPYFDDVLQSGNVDHDLARARIDRTMPLYTRLLPWARLFLKDGAPTTYRGRHLAFALLFPMEQVFEDYVTRRLRRELAGWTVSGQEARFHLMERNPQGRPEFLLKPDIVARKPGQPTQVLDAKWKRLDGNRLHYGISQADLYQLHAYGRKYWVREQAERPPRLYLLYPWHREFPGPLDYEYENGLRLGVRAVRLDDERTPILDAPSDLWTSPEPDGSLAVQAA